jgi:hypothetical protein
MTVKYNLANLSPAARVRISCELNELGILFNLHEHVLSIADVDEEAVDNVIADQELVEELLEADQREARAILAGDMSPRCELCGNQPAAELSLRRQVGMVIVMSSYRAEVVLCGPCGENAYRDFQKQTAIKGWTGVRSALTNPVVIGTNAANIKKHRNQIAELNMRRNR